MSKITIVSPGSTLQLNPMHSGFAHGFGIFETLKLEGRRVYFWAAHWSRLKASAAALGLALSVSEAEVLAALSRLVLDAGLSAGTLKLSLLREGEGTHLYVYARTAHAWPESLKLRLGLDVPLNEYSLLSGHKTHNYMENVLLWESCRADGFDDQIRVNGSGHLAETAMSNLFFQHDGAWHTPSLATGILPGVVRGEVLRMEAVREGCFQPALLGTAEAVFITNSSVGICPVSRIEGAGVERSFDSAALSRVASLQKALAEAEGRNAVSLG